jgi:hypothetical protein
MIGVAGIASSFAQNVYSVNVVGYINLTQTTEFGMIANQLDDGNGNLVTNIVTGVPNLTVVYKFNGVGYASLTWFASLNRWNPASDGLMTMAPGEGVFVKKPAGAAQINYTFVGEVLQGSLTNPVAAGFEIYSPMVPQEGGLVAVHNYTPANLDIVYQWTGAGYVSKTWFASLNRWNPAGDPIIKVGEAFFLKATAAKNWVRDFAVGP